MLEPLKAKSETQQSYFVRIQGAHGGSRVSEEGWESVLGSLVRPVGTGEDGGDRPLV